MNFFNGNKRNIEVGYTSEHTTPRMGRFPALYSVRTNASPSESFGRFYIRSQLMDISVTYGLYTMTAAYRRSLIISGIVRFPLPRMNRNDDIFYGADLCLLLYRGKGVKGKDRVSGCATRGSLRSHLDTPLFHTSSACITLSLLQIPSGQPARTACRGTYPDEKDWPIHIERLRVWATG